MSFLKALVAGFVIVLSMVVFTFVYGYLGAAPNEKATSIFVLLLSPYYWILMIMLVAVEAWWLMRHRAG